MTALDPTGPAPETREPRFLWLLFGAAAAPLAWLGHMMLGYGVTAYVCYPGDHPVTLASNTPLFAALLTFDGLALGLCVAGALVSWRIWGRVRGRQGRNRFLALWGLMSSLWFLAAILFNVIASVMVPLCAG
jgi:hypothetical protein